MAFLELPQSTLLLQLSPDRSTLFALTAYRCGLSSLLVCRDFTVIGGLCALSKADLPGSGDDLMPPPKALNESLLLALGGEFKAEQLTTFEFKIQIIGRMC